MARVERRTKELWVSESCRALLSQDDKRIYASKPHKWEMPPAQFADLQPRTGAPFSISWDERRLDLFGTSERAMKHDLCLLKTREYIQYPPVAYSMSSNAQYMRVYDSA